MAHFAGFFQTNRRAIALARAWAAPRFIDIPIAISTSAVIVFKAKFVYYASVVQRIASACIRALGGPTAPIAAARLTFLVATVAHFARTFKNCISNAFACRRGAPGFGDGSVTNMTSALVVFEAECASISFVSSWNASACVGTLIGPAASIAASRYALRITRWAPVAGIQPTWQSPRNSLGVGGATHGVFCSVDSDQNESCDGRVEYMKEFHLVGER